MGLETYHQKRDFGSTAEPEGAVGVSDPERLSFVVQKHAARRLHYDFRLELDGVLLSWAVPKGPSLDPGEKRLAMRTEDHPLDYGGFEGTIPKGDYGGGTVLLWDRGTWKPDGDAHAAMAKGALAFELHGERMKGGWRLVRTGPPGEKESWLLFKSRDDEARRGDGTTLVDTHVTSVETGRGLDEIAEDKDRTWTQAGERPTAKELARLGVARKVPWPLEPQLATLAKVPPTGSPWVHEIKLDGYRVLVRVERGKASIATRSGLDWTEKMKGIAAAAVALPVDSCVLDGEVVALDDEGRTSFSALQQELGRGGRHLFVFAFDLAALDGRDLRGEPLEIRKQLLARVVPTGRGTIRLNEHVDADGASVLEQACSLGAEGIVSKRVDRPYVSGRTKDWIKTKCLGREDFVIGGYVEREKHLASVLLGEPGKEGLVYVGRAGTGFTEASRRGLRKRLDTLAIDDNPFTRKPPLTRGDRAVWVRPELRAEVAFTERTRDGLLRHPVFQGLREDMVPATPEPRVSSPTKVLYPEDGITKGELATWVSTMAPLLLPSLTGRPLTLVRCPNGHHVGPRFYQKHHEHMPEGVFAVDVPREDEPYCEIRDEPGLVALVQIACLEVHPWGSRSDDRPDRPDRFIIDFDPDEAVPFSAVVDAAFEVRDRLEHAGLVSFVRTTGGKGLHVVAPLQRRQGWDDVRGAALLLAEEMVRSDPKRYVAVAAKAKRKGKIYIDWLRNAFGATATGSWWFRARAHAPIARPLAWDDLRHDLDPGTFTVRTVTAPPPDPWEGIDDVKQSLTAKVVARLSG